MSRKSVGIEGSSASIGVPAHVERAVAPPRPRLSRAFSEHLLSLSSAELSYLKRAPTDEELGLAITGGALGPIVAGGFSYLALGEFGLWTFIIAYTLFGSWLVSRWINILGRWKLATPKDVALARRELKKGENALRRLAHESLNDPSTKSPRP